jgi:YggT family protein
MVQFIQVLANLLTLIVIVDVLASWVLPNPYHPFRQAVHGIVEPMLGPIRRLIPPVGMIDFSPMILILVIQIIEVVLVNLLAR